MRTHTRIAALVLGLGTAAALAGCGNGVTGSSGGSADSSPTATTTATASPSASPTPSPVPSTTQTSGQTSGPTSGSTPAPTDQTPGQSPSPVPAARCTTKDLNVGVDDADGGGAMGSVYLLLTFANHSKNSCTLSGHPGVSFVGKSAGTQLGAPAVREGKITTIVLRPGERTTAVLRIGQAGNYDAKACAPTTSDGFRVYPPGSTTSVFVAYKSQACQKDVSKLSPQLSISAVGTRQ